MGVVQDDQVRLEGRVGGTYQDQFSRREDAAAYEYKEYGAGSYPSKMWGLQQGLLRRVLAEKKQGGGAVRLLDFACGTGRVLSFVEGLVEESEGVDLSAAMVEIAAAKCGRSRLFIGELDTLEALRGVRYDVVTVFRLLLNMDEGDRAKVLSALRGRLAKGGILVANVHGNKWSMRHLGYALRKSWLGRKLVKTRTVLRELSPREVEGMLEAAGFEVAGVWGYGVVPPVLYRTPLKVLAWWVDKACARVGWLKWCSYDLVYVCRGKR